MDGPPMLYDGDFPCDPSEVVDVYLATLPPLVADQLLGELETAYGATLLPTSEVDAPTNPDVVVERARIMIAVVDAIIGKRHPMAANCEPMLAQARSELGEQALAGEDPSAVRAWLTERAEGARRSDVETQWRIAAEEWRTLRESFLSVAEMRAWSEGVRRAFWATSADASTRTRC